MNAKMEKVKCFLLDMDGTICLDNDVFDGAIEAVERMKKRGRVLFLTNNSSKTPEGYVEKLNKMGFNVTLDNIYTSAMATTAYLKAHYDGKKIYLFANKAVKARFIEEGVIPEENHPDLIVIAFNTEFDYDELKKLCNFIREGVPFICTHDDVNCPTVRGYKPDVGSYLSLIYKSTGKKPLAVCGKPYSIMGDCISEMCGFSRDEIAMFGDRLATDIKFGVNNGFVVTLVLTGEATAEEAAESGLDIDFILPSVCDWDK
ncbi:MAG: HAD-IIA family hydrolase [Candidatus Neoclostridium sp.]